MASTEVTIHLSTPVTTEQLRAARVAAARAAAWRLHLIGELHQLFQGDNCMGQIPGSAMEGVQFLVDLANTLPGVLKRIEELATERDILLAANRKLTRALDEARAAVTPFTTTGPIHPEKSRGKYR